MHNCLPTPLCQASQTTQHMDTTAQQPQKRTHNSHFFHKCGKATTHTHHRAADRTRHALPLSLALPFICFSPHFQQIRSQYSCACASPQSGMHLEKASSNSDWRQAGRQREKERKSEGEREREREREQVREGAEDWMKQEEVYGKRRGYGSDGVKKRKTMR